MKKLTKLALAASLVAGLAGCAGGETNEDKTLNIAGLDGGYGKAGWEAVVAAFQETDFWKENYSDYTIELTLEKNIAETLRPVIVAGKDVPDVVYLSVGAEGKLTDTMISEKQLTEITDFLDLTVPGEDAKVSDKILAGFTEGPTVTPYGDGKLYLAPLFYGPCGLYYNKTLLADNGWTVPTTWEEMWDLGEKAKAKGIALFTYPTTGYFDAFFSSLLNVVAGPETYTKLMNYDVEAWKSEDVKKAFEIVGKLATYTESSTVANANKDGFTKNQQLVLDNKAIFVPNGTWLPGEMSSAPRAEGFEWGVAAIPALNAGEKGYATTFTEQMYIPSAATNADLAKAFMAFCYSDKATDLFFNTEYTATNDKGEEETKKVGALQPTTASKGLLAEADQFMYAHLENANSNTVGFAAAEAVEGVDLTSAEGILYGTVNAVVNGDKTVEQWHTEVVEAVTKISEANAK